MSFVPTASPNSSSTLPSADAFPSSPTPIAEPWIRRTGAISFLLLALLSLTMNLLLALIFVKGRRQFRRTVFYAIAWQLILCDICAQLIQLAIAVPITWTGRQVYGQSPIFFAVLFFDTVAYNGTLYFSTLMTLSRLAVFFSDKANRLFFTGGGQIWVICLIWCLVFGYVIGNNVTGCRKSFSEIGFYLYHDCLPPNTLGQLLRQFSALASNYIPLLMLLAYLLLFLHVRRSYRISSEAMSTAERRRSRRKELAILLQSFIICSALEVQNLAFIFIPHFPLTGQLSFFVNFAENWVCILLNTVGPISMFCFNEEVRRIGRGILTRKSEVFFTRASRL